MGSICSKPGAHEGGHHVLGSNAESTGQRQVDHRTAAAEAAERRQKAAQARGTHSSNPNQGKLAALAAKPAKFTPEPRQEERLVVSSTDNRHFMHIITYSNHALVGLIVKELFPSGQDVS
ncbi:hypothetical protein K435DRAFT_850465 [Dendrothele bispora CBS 962.96]|uniref:Uncharacterized protein n=1 Tax=Dendrothele bispora (strain CBS 962.96) TaxID=1314807 RepID=A0A4S8MPS7_DENBC|nr:hypothetical protein K435DRAFT_850465 [Dendrothele bispora CBS 962.96]